ncbi:hypothetical protein CLOM_g3257 [Closterium sp. NIES-68]|nr:hypothetical protein CLOM_g3257 [Closterium sp. NIES-68]GJP58860.1 hypothetical protein CLOP_g5546 [Closterium sp. NIES-67]
MARNEEKANAVLNRFWAAKQDEKRKPREKRPFLASECRDLSDADKWRQQILREIGRRVTEIQNPGLGEHRLKDLNDEINKLIREKGHWEKRIVELGGPNYAKQGPKITDADGKEVGDGDDELPAGSATGKGLGYRYFGAAKNLPGVRELFEKPTAPTKKRNRYELYKRIDMDYYGYRDEEDGILVRLETEAEREIITKAVSEWEALEAVKAEARRAVKSGEEASIRVQTDLLDELGAPIETRESRERRGIAAQEGIGAEGEEERDEEETEEAYRERADARARREEAALDAAEEAALDAVGGRRFVAHVPLPDEKEIERMVVAKKKAELLSKYASEALVQEEEEAKELLNIKR